MVYIVIEYPTGFKDYATEKIFNNKIKAQQYCNDLIKCNSDEIKVNLYEAINEYTNKRKLIKEY